MTLFVFQLLGFSVFKDFKRKEAFCKDINPSNLKSFGKQMFWKFRKVNFSVHLSFLAGSRFYDQLLYPVEEEKLQCSNAVMYFK